MFTLSNPHVLAASASTAAVVNATAALDSVTSGTDAFDGAPPVALGASATSVLAPAAGTQILAKALHFYNTSASPVTLNVFYPTSSNQVYQGIIPANGSITWTPDNGWQIYNNSGSTSKPMVKTDTFTISGSSAGPYPVTFYPDGKAQSAGIGNTFVPPSEFTLSSSGITFTGAIATLITGGSFNGVSGAVTYSYSS